jgi:hypothetical protein
MEGLTAAQMGITLLVSARAVKLRRGRGAYQETVRALFARPVLLLQVSLMASRPSREKPTSPEGSGLMLLVGRVCDGGVFVQTKWPDSERCSRVRHMADLAGG